MQLSLDTQLLDRFVPQTRYLETLSVWHMAEMHPPARNLLFNMIEKIIQGNENTLSTLDLAKLSEKCSEGERLLQTLANSKIR